MKKFFALTLLSFIALSSHADETQVVAKGIQCSYLRELSYVNFYAQYDAEKAKGEYIKKVSDSIYSQGFKICDPENTANADKDILSSCVGSCDQAVSKGVIGIGGQSASDVEKCKKMCQNYSELLGMSYAVSQRSIKKYTELAPKAPAPVVPVSPTPPSTATGTNP